MQALREYGERLTNRDLYNMRVDMEATSTPGWKKQAQLVKGNFHDFTTYSVSACWRFVQLTLQCCVLYSK